MDIDVMSRQLRTLLDFKDRIEGMMESSDGNVERATAQLDRLMAFESLVEGLLPALEKTIADVAVVIDDVGKLKADMAPALAWIAEQQKAAEDLKAAVKSTHEALAAADAKSVGEAQASEAAPKQPTLDTVAGALRPSAPAERSESEHSVG
jgi:peptidoglycan hydrolase CwlO-like protein